MERSARLPIAHGKPICATIASCLCALAMLAICGGFPASALEAGYAQADITPLLGSPLAGRIDRWGRGSETIHDPLAVRCLYLANGEESIYWISADLFSITHDLRQAVLRMTPDSIDPNRIILTATHTHSGAGGMERGLVRRVTSGRFSQAAIDETARQILDVMVRAEESRRRAAAGAGSFEWAPPETMAGVNAQPGVAHVLRVEDSDGAPIVLAVIGSWMADNVGRDELLTVSADFPGYLCDAIEDAYPGAAGAMYINGQSADAARMEMPDTTSWDAIETMGRSIGTRAAEVAAAIDCGDFPLTMQTRSSATPRSLGNPWLPDEVRLTWCQAGGMSVVFTPFGLGAGSLPIEAPGGGVPPVVAGLANGYAGHVVSGEAYASGVASARAHYFGPDAASWLGAEIGALVDGGVDEDAPPESSSDGAAETAPLDWLVVTEAETRHQSASLSAVVRESYESRILEASAEGALLPDRYALAHLPWFVDTSPVGLPQLAVEFRPAWARLSDDQKHTLSRFADAAQLPLEGAWLLQKVEAALGYAGAEPQQIPSPRRFAAAVHGDKAGADGVIAVARLDWPFDEPIAAARRADEAGQHVVTVAPAHALGAMAGMNDGGVIAVILRNPERGWPRVGFPPLAMQIEMALAHARTAQELVEVLTSNASIDGYDVFITDPAANSALVLRGTNETTPAAEANGLSSYFPVPFGATSTFDTLEGLVRNERIVSPDELAEFMAEPTADSEQPVQKSRTLTLVFEPARGAVRLRLDDVDGSTEYQTVSLEPDGP